MNFRNKRSGFTLVEVLVAITIIGLLSAVVYSNFSGVRGESRDLERQTDLRTLEIAIELYKKKNGQYPAGCNGAGNWSGDPASSYACSGNQQYIIGLAPEFIPVLPYDPKLNGNNSGYVYTTNTDGSVYKLMAMRTVESEKVHYCHELASCDIASDPWYNVGTVPSVFSDCADDFSKSARARNPSTAWPAKYGWCTQVDTNLNSGVTIDSSVSRCKMNSTPFTDGGNGRFESSYAVWGGYHEDDVQLAGIENNNELGKIDDTSNIICK